MEFIGCIGFELEAEELIAQAGKVFPVLKIGRFFLRGIAFIALI
jgi:hypothetical protein